MKMNIMIDIPWFRSINTTHRIAYINTHLYIKKQITLTYVIHEATKIRMLFILLPSFYSKLSDTYTAESTLKKPCKIKPCRHETP